MARQVTLCNLFLYEVQDISVDELRQKSENVIEAMTSYLDEETKCSEKLHFYKMDSSNRPLKSIQSYEDLTSGSYTILAVDLFQLGQSCLNQNSFQSASGNSAEKVAERHRALKLLTQFVDKISSHDKNDFASRKFRVDLAKECLHSKYIEDNLASKTSHDTCKRVSLSNLQSDSDGADTVVFDHLISVCKSLNQQACKIMHDQIQLYNWAEIVQKGDSITRTVIVQNAPCDVTLHSDVFECICQDCYNDENRLRVNGVLGVLGAGAFGIACKYTTTQLHSNITLDLVIKQSKLVAEFESKPGWYREVHHTKELSHENVIKYFGKPILFRDNCYCIMEFGGMALNDLYLNNDLNNIMAPKDIKQAMRDISSAIDYLHGHIVIHRDIRTSNVTVSSSRVYKLIDFGLSSEKTALDSKFCSDIHWGHFFWKSPEYCEYIINLCKEDHKAPGRSSDIWMFGVFVLEMLSFPGMPRFFKDYTKHMGPRFMSELVDKTRNVHDSIDTHWDPEIRNILLHCLEFDEKTRADSKELLGLCTQLEQPEVQEQYSETSNFGPT